jgi:NAD(P)H-dependent FMN reductase
MTDPTIEIMTGPRLLIVIASTRPGRIGLPVANWFRKAADEHGGFDIEVADLAEERLPLLDEPKHPRLREYQHEHTKRWSAKVDAADAFAFVMPEYNYSFNGALKNAIDYLFAEWAHKPVALVSYGGISAGTRAAAAIRIPLSALGVVVVTLAVSIPFPHQFLADGVIEPNEIMTDSAKAALVETHRLAVNLARLRGKAVG